MPTTHARFTQIDVKRLLKAARAIDPDLTVKMLPDGSLILVKGADDNHEAPIDARAEIRL